MVPFPQRPTKKSFHSPIRINESRGGCCLRNRFVASIFFILCFFLLFIFLEDKPSFFFLSFSRILSLDFTFIFEKAISLLKIYFIKKKSPKLPLPQNTLYKHYSDTSCTPPKKTINKRVNITKKKVIFKSFVLFFY